jgi:hypothetical protein
MNESVSLRVIDFEEESGMKITMWAIAVIVTMIVIFGPVHAAPVITVDGDLSDWGLTQLQTGDWSKEATWLPADGVRYIIEDNYDPKLGASSYTGVHITGSGSSYVPYSEPLRPLRSDPTELVKEPYGGELSDVDAFYFTQDADKFYVAVITSAPPDGAGDLRGGDLAIKIGPGGMFGYDWGVKLSSLPPFSQGAIIKDPVWEGKGYLLPAGPDMIIGGTDTGKTAPIVYNSNWLINKPEIAFGTPYTKYVIELAVNKADLGVTGPIDITQLKLEQNCHNDSIYLPEFPTIAISFGLIGALGLVIYSMQSKKD